MVLSETRPQHVPAAHIAAEEEEEEEEEEGLRNIPVLVLSSSTVPDCSPTQRRGEWGEEVLAVTGQENGYNR